MTLGEVEIVMRGHHSSGRFGLCAGEGGGVPGKPDGSLLIHRGTLRSSFVRKSTV